MEPKNQAKERKFVVSIKKEKFTHNQQVGCLPHLQPDQILGATYRQGQLMFLMKGQNNNIANWVISKEAKERCPQNVIRFYQERIVWENEGSTAGPGPTGPGASTKTEKPEEKDD